MECIGLQRVTFSADHGKMGNRMDAVSTCGQMVVYMWETTSTVTDKAKGT